MVAQSLGYASEAFGIPGDAVAASPTPPIQSSPRQPFLRIAVLRI